MKSIEYIKEIDKEKEHTINEENNSVSEREDAIVQIDDAIEEQNLGEIQVDEIVENLAGIQVLNRPKRVNAV